jgi:hypothetical protein
VEQEQQWLERAEIVAKAKINANREKIQRKTSELQKELD